MANPERVFPTLIAPRLVGTADAVSLTCGLSNCAHRILGVMVENPRVLP